MRAHLRDLYAFYGEAAGVRIARKHIGWYCRDQAGGEVFRKSVMQALSASAQLELVRAYFDALGDATATADGVSSFRLASWMITASSRASSAESISELA